MYIMTIFNVSSRIISANHCWNVFPFMNILTTTQRNAQSHLREQFVIFFFPCDYVPELWENIADSSLHHPHNAAN